MESVSKVETKPILDILKNTKNLVVYREAQCDPQCRTPFLNQARLHLYSP